MVSGERILMGVVGRPHGVRGLVRVHSYAAVPADLSAYGALSDERGGSWTLRWRGDGIAELTDANGTPVQNREQAAALTNRKLYVTRDRLPEPEEDEFYLADLVGLQAAESGSGKALGRVLAVHDYGAGVSLEIGAEGRGTLLLPFTRACVPEAAVAAGRLSVILPHEEEVPGLEEELDGASSVQAES